LVVVGTPWSGEEVELLNELGIGGEVYLKTDVTDRELAELYNQAAAFVFPSLYEGFGLPLLEAMACGCPVVASDIPTNRELAREVAAFFEPQAIDDLLIALDQALDDTSSAEKVGWGIERASTYSWDKTARQTLEIYHALV
jgi:glycosyltransferase involved in cell wall biosynthesis